MSEDATGSGGERVHLGQAAPVGGPVSASAPIPAWRHIDRFSRWLETARKASADATPDLAKAAEWLLDNDYQVHRAIRQVQEDLPARFYARLRVTRVPEGGFPHVFVIAHDLLRQSRMQLSLAVAVSRIREEQERQPLTIAELWAFPTMLRLACLEVLAVAFARLFPAVEAPFEPSPFAVREDSFDDVERVARAIANLALVASIPWEEFFDRSSRVEEILRKDPAGVYARMDFATRDSYRRAVEQLADTANAQDWDVADAVVRRSMECAADDKLGHHVGHWLTGRGRRQFEASLGCRIPRKEAVVRRIAARGRQLYGVSLLVVGLGALVLPALYMASLGAPALSWIVYLIVAIIPASILSITLVHWAITQIISPKVLPKLDFEDGIAEDCRTLVAVPVLVGSAADAALMVERLEQHRLANPDPCLQFVLLTDLPDAAEEHRAQDTAVEAALVAGIHALNGRYGGDCGPFHLLHRARRFNPAEGRWMGWERKRGKLEQLNRLLLGEDDGGFVLRIGNPAALNDIRYVVTVDADTRLPAGSVARLVGTLAHPLNRAQTDPVSGRIVSGYSILQPRVEVSPESGNRSIFARLYTGDTAIDIYSRAVSDIYQDLFGEGIFVGKGIYDVRHFHSSVDGRIPENSILSHDLLEGILGRAALASDIVLYENFPETYLEFVRRSHRWIRGDWQLSPWLFPKVPGRDGSRLPNPLTALGRWKMLDNLRRSVIAPGLILFALAGWTILPGSPWVWTALTILAPGAHLFTDVISGLARGPRRGSIRGMLAQWADQLGRWFLAIAFLPKEAAIALHAIGLTLWRVAVSRRHLLQWTSAAEVAARFNQRRSRAWLWREMWVGPALAALIACGILILHPAALPAAAILLLLWTVSPELGLWIGRTRLPEHPAMSSRDRLFLRMLARRTWLYFETFAGPEDHWLPPDNYQEPPFEEIAHRTSPTNIGMMFLSGFTAWDLGHIGTTELAARLANAADTLGHLETHRGHLLNWYDTRTLDPLEPRYVSTVDSGNLAVSLVTTASGCREAASGPLFDARRWDGLGDLVAILQDVLMGLPARDSVDLHAILESMGKVVDGARNDPGKWRSALQVLQDVILVRFTATITRLMSPQSHLSSNWGDLPVWTERLTATLRGMLRDLDHLLPWWQALAAPPQSLVATAFQIQAVLRSNPPEEALRIAVRQARELLPSTKGSDAAAAEWIGALAASFDAGLRNQQELAEQLLALANRASNLAFGMDFAPLYNAERRLFHIGYNVSSDRLDPHFYDLLATEARIASYFAIAKGDVHPEHWFFLGRPLTRENGSICLLSWNGSMFEYLMAPIFLRSGPETLVGQSERVAVDIQRAYGRRLGIPWGISESAFALRDPENRYRYQAFGSPGLGLKRDLGKDLVVAPYASALALTTEPAYAVENLRRLHEEGAAGTFGLFEAVDFSSGRAEANRKSVPVNAYMAHHQGMILSAIGNALCADIFMRRFRAEPRMSTVDLLLSERVPREVPSEIDRIHERPPAPQAATLYPPPHAWTPESPSAFPQMLALGNGRLSCSVSEAGGGRLLWRGRAITRFVADATLDDQGLWIYVKDDETGDLWSAARQPTGAESEEYRATFHPHAAEFHRRDHGIAMRTEIAIAESEDVEVRRVTLVNESAHARRLRVTSYGEVVLAPPLDDERHPAFSKLFVHSESLPDGGLLFHRRPRHPHESPPVLIHRLIASDEGVTIGPYETDRRQFLGRGGDKARPAALDGGLAGSHGWTLDPVMALQALVELPPHESRQLCFVTTIGGSRKSAIETAERYASPASVQWVFDDSAAAAVREAQRLAIDPHQFPLLQRLASYLVYPHPSLRGPEASLRANRDGQPQLWGMGISGDRPILLLRLGHGEQPSLLAELVKGHRLWARRGIEVDLVVLNTKASSYLEPTRDELTNLLEASGAREFLGRPGGVHLAASDQIGPGMIRLLESAACVVIEESEGSLAHQLESIRPHRREIPSFQPVDAVDDGPDVPLPAREPLLFDVGIGGIDAKVGEYVICLPPGTTTPAPWCNVLANEDFGTLVTEAGGGFTWAENSGENRLTPWSNDPVCDTPGELLYLRDEETGAVWTPTPFAADGDCEISHGRGYTRWRQNTHHLEQELTIFVPVDDPVKIFRLRIRNLAKRPRRVTATAYVEWLLGAVPSVATPGVVAEYDSVDRIATARNPWNPDFGSRCAFLTASADPHSLTLDRHEFLGQEGNLRDPAGLRRWGLSGEASSKVDPCAAWQVHLDLGGEAHQDVLFILGQGSDRRDAAALAAKWRSVAAVDEGFERLQRQWGETLGSIRAETPDPAFDQMINHWLLYQTISSRVRARAGFYQAGGAFGFRDQLQDMLALLHVDPGQVRRHILVCAAHQFEEGDVMHWWHPPSGRGVRTRCSDDLVWLPFVVGRYLEATGDRSILDERIPFLRAAPLAADEEDRYSLFDAGQEASLFDHCIRAIEHGATQGTHALPLMGSGDWNDGMDRVGRQGRGESIWLAWFFIVTLTSFAAIARREGRDDLADAWLQRADGYRKGAEAHGWDGEWYRRAFDDAGEPWGSAANAECRIDSISQSWAVLAEARPDRAVMALRSAQRELVRQEDRLVLLLTPPFDRTDRDPGYIRGYPPGVRENGGQYTHAAAWLGFASAKLRDGDETYRVFDLLNPLKRAHDRESAEHYRGEPYVLAADIAAGEPHTGRAGWTWYTGSSAWLWRLGVEAILGITPVEDGVMLNPCLPRHWKRCDVTLRRGSGTLSVRIEDPDGLGSGELELRVNGQAWATSRIPFPQDGSSWDVVGRIRARADEEASPVAGAAE
jgi:cyclic beta-1,2-glucan synthetase